MKKGIDVSYHQGTIDWKKVADSGIEFVMIRAGYGKNTVDKKFLENIAGAHDAGLDIGIYWFIYAINEDDAIKNADFCAKTIEPYKDIVTMKVAADWEYDSDNYSIKNGIRQTTESRTRIVRAFLERLKSKGYEVCNYANPDYLKGKFEDLSEYPPLQSGKKRTMDDIARVHERLKHCETLSDEEWDKDARAVCATQRKQK